MKRGVGFTLLLLLISLASLSSAAFWEDEYIQLGPSDPQKAISFTLQLTLHNLDRLSQILDSVSDPLSADYGKHRSMTELSQLIGPSEETQREVLDSLREFGINGTSYGHFIKAEAPASTVDRVFGTQMLDFAHHHYSDVITSKSLVHPTIPSSLSEHVQFVSGLSNFAASHKKMKRQEKPIRRRFEAQNIEEVQETQDMTVIPQTIRSLYNIPSTARSTNPQNSACIVEFALVAGISSSDLSTFMQLVGGDPNTQLSSTLGNFRWVPILPINGESTLDVQYILSIGVGVPTSFWVVDGWMYDLTTLIIQREQQGLDVPLVFSLSYGWNEADQCSITNDCNTLGGSSASYVQAVSANFQIIGASGVTVLVSSGDAGAASKTNIDCTDSSSPVNPDYPASDPYITSVGGTMLELNNQIALPSSSLPPFCLEYEVVCAGGGVEEACTVPTSLITTGGGFSNVFPSYNTATYQKGAVSGWMDSGAIRPPQQFWNRNGRGYPDISALAHNYMIVEKGDCVQVDGTSASAPVMAGLVALINDLRLNSGKSPLGFFNPLLYSSAQSRPSFFQDVLVGDNTGTEMNGLLMNYYCYTFGFGAATGWDPCTGLGSPSLWLNGTSPFFL